MEISKKIGFFDVDSRELSEDGKELSFRDRVSPIIKKLDLLYDFAYKNKIKILFSTCCSGRFLKKNSFDYVLYVPLSKKDRSWEKKIDNFRYYYIAKRTYNNPRKNSEACLYNIFRYNENCMDLIKKLKIKKWVIFGNGFNFCVYNICKKMLKNNIKIIILKDTVIQGIKQNKNDNLETQKIKILEELKKDKAEIMTQKEFFKIYK